MMGVSKYQQERIEQVMAASPLVPVITVHKPEHALPLAEALVEGGIRVLEVTLRTEHGLAAIEQLRSALPDAWVGAGTVTSVEQYRAVERAGAQFVITPGVTEAVLEHGATSQAPLLPGIATISELMMGYALGYRAFKFFPAEVSGGKAALKAFAGPFADVLFCPTGGIRQDTAKDYLALANVQAVGGTWLTPAEALEQGDWSRISTLARESLALL
ncbi:MAG: bifunctional 4-hydroxy-2-oxoglutarate aldolase/2-dehydro-3-deoxy-phosphogluconate aldolase [Marinobacter sp.]|uniref:bifunctional 4-hydroxy-2-oxoglutarate aldolase/2-dehydro-3-deoxy-phosphogluconate aldolase n=1 Tax=Marinobacter sp. TaxID=50741 RepID=UPI00299EA368|nr:bifunctional 4-hydroxy-2-oxoglutarate aldolase/2-dehydro-3-deoxy-phosphogluconate aldolase [Marinobacter sp.]MDX1756579.1 bifunctional 4-hydroxy-2-oxoglutarate aldolase/2-dehydro-3-deoxy-phosphogluconate aldolase [Marinobacter sp.]